MPNFKIKLTIIIALALVLTTLDRLAKALSGQIWAQNPLPIIKNWLTLTYTANPYIAFSLPLGGQILTIFIAIVIIILAFFWLKYIKSRNLTLAGPLTFILFGAISNIVDRLKYNYVIDYLSLTHFSTFNLADAMICLGVCWLIFFSLLKKNY